MQPLSRRRASRCSRSSPRTPRRATSGSARRHDEPFVSNATRARVITGASQTAALRTLGGRAGLFRMPPTRACERKFVDNSRLARISDTPGPRRRGAAGPRRSGPVTARAVGARRRYLTGETSTNFPYHSSFDGRMPLVYGSSYGLSVWRYGWKRSFRFVDVLNAPYGTRTLTMFWDWRGS